MAHRPLPLWLAQTRGPGFPALDRDLLVDVAVIGGGITGLTTALLCKLAGLQVAVIDAHLVAGGETGHTTSHLTELVDHRYHVLIKRFGAEKARKVAESQRAAIERIATFVEQYGIDCGFERVPGFLYSESSRDLMDLMKERNATQALGLSSRYVDLAPLPFLVRGAIRLDNQAQIDPVRYLLPLAQRVNGDGSFVFENTRAVNIDDGEPCTVVTDKGTIRAHHVVIATNAVMNGLVLHTRVAAYRSYAVAATVEQLPPPGLYWDTEDPYHYTRSQQAADGRRYLIVGGNDHKTGRHVDTEQVFDQLEDYVRSRYDVVSIDYRWSGQIMEPIDGLPYIGNHTSMDNVYVATGYSGTGMTFGTVAGMLLSDLILGLDNPWASLYDPKRLGPMAAAKEFVAENVDFPLHFVADRVRPAEAHSTAELGPGEGAIVHAAGKKVAVYRDEGGQVHAMSPVCSHMGCHVAWNKAEKSWDCPCHGGRYDARGVVINGPPTRDLKPLPFPEEQPQKEEASDERTGSAEETAP